MPDPRGLRYPLAALLSVAVCAVMTGASAVTAISGWLHDLGDIARARLGFVRGVPATTTMWRLLIRLDADLLATVLAGWLRSPAVPAAPRRARNRQFIAVDGKTVRGTRRPDGSQIHLLVRAGHQHRCRFGPRHRECEILGGVTAPRAVTPPTLSQARPEANDFQRSTIAVASPARDRRLR
ncbi:transposase family protein [Actinoplanes sp. NPDC049599]|uniref:transposase family protein n=1 Tax=Actinoplanes sp. NPDC049599 TaxID=3363903 RepID=UPI0037ADAC23